MIIISYIQYSTYNKLQAKELNHVQSNDKIVSFQWQAQDYPAWTTKIIAYLQTKALFKALFEKEILPKIQHRLAQRYKRPNGKQKFEKEINKIEKIQARNNTVLCHTALSSIATVFIYCLPSDGFGDGAKAWHLQQQTIPTSKSQLW